MRGLRAPMLRRTRRGPDRPRGTGHRGRRRRGGTGALCSPARAPGATRKPHAIHAAAALGSGAVGVRGDALAAARAQPPGGGSPPFAHLPSRHGHTIHDLETLDRLTSLVAPQIQTPSGPLVTILQPACRRATCVLSRLLPSSHPRRRYRRLPSQRLFRGGSPARECAVATRHRAVVSRSLPPCVPATSSHVTRGFRQQHAKSGRRRSHLP